MIRTPHIFNSFRVREFNKKWSPLIKEAKGELAKQRADHPGSSGLSPLRVGHLRALIVARTGKGPKATNNKDFALKHEAAGCIHLPIIVHTPPPSPPRGADKSSDDDDTDDDAAVLQMLDADLFGEAFE